MDGYEMDGRELRVDYARHERPASFGGGRGGRGGRGGASPEAAAPAAAPAPAPSEAPAPPAETGEAGSDS